MKFDSEIKAEELADPLVLYCHQKALVQQVLEAVVVRAHHKVAPLEVGPPMPHNLHQPDKLSLVGGKLEMASGE
jgi:hypothetical protein